MTDDRLYPSAIGDIELRFVRREVVRQGHDHLPPETYRMLQWRRAEFDNTHRHSHYDPTDGKYLSIANLKWGEWTDVPEVAP